MPVSDTDNCFGSSSNMSSGCKQSGCNHPRVHSLTGGQRDAWNSRPSLRVCTHCSDVNRLLFLAESRPRDPVTEVILNAQVISANDGERIGAEQTWVESNTERVLLSENDVP